MKIKDIANDLHLSISTVSKALNGAFDVSKETKELVIQYAKLNGYKSKDERLNTKKLRRLCVLYDNVDYTSQSNTAVLVALAFSKYARLYNFEVIHSPIDIINKSYEKYMAENNFDGAFIVGLNYKSPLLLELKNTSIPTVLYDNVITSDKISTISCENINMMVKMVSLLYERGHRKIGFIHGDKNSFVGNERYAGYIIGLVMKGIEYNPKYVYFGKFSQESGFCAAKYFKQTDVTAIICASDIIAVGLINGLNNEGLHVPDDISVTGYDDLDIAKYITPTLTTVKQDLEKMGEKAFSLMTSILMNRSSQKIVIDGEIEIRNSIGPVKNRK